MHVKYYIYVSLLLILIRLTKAHRRITIRYTLMKEVTVRYPVGSDDDYDVAPYFSFAVGTKIFRAVYYYIIYYVESVFLYIVT